MRQNAGESDGQRHGRKSSRSRRGGLFAAAMLAAALARGGEHAGAPAIAATGASPPAGRDAPAVDWSGWFFGGQMGDAWGHSRWTATGPGAESPASGSFGLSEHVDLFNQSGSFFGGLHAGYDRMLASRIVLGAEAQVSFPSFPNLAGISIGGASSLPSPSGPAGQYGENMLYFGSLRGRIGYAPGNFLLFATGGLAFAYDQLMLAPADGEPSASPLVWRLGWNLGAGVTIPLGTRWTAELEYSYSRFGRRSVLFSGAGGRFASDLALQELHLGLSYRFGEAADAAALGSSLLASAADRLALHGQATFSYQGNAGFPSPYEGANSLPGRAQAREVTDASLSAGLRLWRGAELWLDPSLDQGFGLSNTHGVAGFPSAEAYKFGSDYPYIVWQRYFIRQTIDLGGARQVVEAGSEQFAGTQTANRLVLTLGSFAITDLFDTNDYANDPKRDFLNWSLINAGSFDYAGNAWGYTDGLALEWYQGRYVLRAGIFDLSATPAGGNSPAAYGLDSSFRQFQWVAEAEEHHHLWGEPGTFKVTGFLSRGRAGRFRDAIALAAAGGLPADINAVRKYTSRPGISINLQQQVTADLGVFARAGWADGNVEPWDFTDIDRTVSGGISLAGTSWRRPRDTVGVAVAINGISGVHQAFLNDGGLGVLIGDGRLPHPGLEKVLESYYSYAVLPSTQLTFDYQLINDPAYNADRGPVNVLAVRIHWRF
jgi:high affinity Mn2+ porin